MFKIRFISLTAAVILLVMASQIPVTAKGGHTEPTGNNLSFPVIWSENASLTMPGTALQASLTVPYTGDAMQVCPDGALAYAQKTVGNVWQAENLLNTEDSVLIDEIDWGDSLESVDMKIGRPVRIELSLYKNLTVPMTGYSMVMLANPSSPDEVQGVCASGDPLTDNGVNIQTYASYQATVFSTGGRLVLQQVTGSSSNLDWDSTLFKWVSDTAGDVSDPIPVTFTGELNVGGKVIYGLSAGGWKPTSTGVYRITFYLPTTGNAQFSANTIIRLPLEEAGILAEPVDDTGGIAYVDWMNNLTYIDITVVGGGGK